MESIPHKTCPKCRIDKPLTEFYKNASNKKDGSTSYCKLCSRASVDAFSLRHPERRKEHRRTERDNRREARRQYDRDRRAKRREAKQGLGKRRRFVPRHLRAKHPEYSVAEWDILCAALGGVCLMCSTSEGLTIDHVIPLAFGGLDHITNLQPLCGVCNSRKQASILDLRDPNLLEKGLLLVHDYRIGLVEVIS